MTRAPASAADPTVVTTGESSGPTFGLLAPLTPLRARSRVGSRAGEPPEDELALVLRSGLVDALWLRDLPVAPVDDDDVGQGTDPFAELAHLAGRDLLPPLVGTASVILGTRHPLVLARQALTVQAQSRGRLVLGVGTGGKPAMNAALGIRHRSLDDFASEWWVVRRALAGDAGHGVRIDVPVACPPPPQYLATTDTERWRSVDGDPDGWLAFAGDERQFSRQLEQLARISGRPVPTAVRVDATVVGSDAAPSAAVPQRGRVTGTIDQLAALLARWRRMPVTHLLVNVRSASPVDDLRRLRQA